MARFTRGGSVRDSSSRANELRVIRAYAIVWLVGRGLAVAMLIWFSLPILWGYCLELMSLFFGGQPSTYSLVDALIWSGLAIAVQGIGLFLWLRGIYRSRSLAWRMFA